MHRHFILHKPYGVISQFKGERKKKFLGDLYDFPEGIMAIGRLDEHSEGLLLLTTDGITSERVRSKKIEKEYHVQVDGLINEEAISKMERGVMIGIRSEKYLTLPCKVMLINPTPDYPPRTKKIRDERHGPTCWISVIITEGKFRQVRKMTAAVGYPTLRLIRVRIGRIHLGNLKSGETTETQDLEL